MCHRQFKHFKKVLIYWCLSITLWGGYHWYPNFTDEETSIQRLNNWPEVTYSWEVEEPGSQSLQSMLEPLCPATPLWQRPRFYISRCLVQHLTQQAPQVYAVTLLTSYHCPSPSLWSLLSLNTPNTYLPQGHCICCSAAYSSLSPGNWKACSMPSSLGSSTTFSVLDLKLQSLLLYSTHYHLTCYPHYSFFTFYFLSPHQH